MKVYISPVAKVLKELAFMLIEEGLADSDILEIGEPNMSPSLAKYQRFIETCYFPITVWNILKYENSYNFAYNEALKKYIKLYCR